jgi:hypothetical protein
MATITPPVLLATGPPPGHTSLRELFGPHEFVVEERPSAGLPTDLRRFAAVILDGRDGDTDILPLCRRLSQWPLGLTAPFGVSAMYNLIGTVPNPADVLAVDGVHLHLYGKSPRPGRKLGHVTVHAPDATILAARRHHLEAALGTRL